MDQDLYEKVERMRTEEEIQAIKNKLYSLVDTGDHTASVIYDTLQWVTGDDDNDPYETHVGEEE